MCLRYHLIMRLKYQSSFNINFRLHDKLGPNITHHMTDKPVLITFEGRDKYILPIGNNIITIVSVKVKTLFVRDISETFAAQPSSCCWQRNSPSNFEMYPWEQLIFHVFLQ